MTKIKTKKLKNRWVLVTVYCSDCNGEYLYITRNFKNIKKDFKECKCYLIKSE